jgi:hypothetical protein
MPIRGIHLKNVSISSQEGMVWMDAENITCENVDIKNTKGPVLSLTHATNAVIDHLTYPANVVAVIEAQGDQNGDIIIKNTDRKVATEDFILTNGASASSFQIKP